MNWKYLFAIILILLGFLLLLDSLGFYDFSDIISTWWPLIIIAFGIVHLTRKNDSIFFSLVVILIGILLQADNLNYFNFDFWDLFLPLLLIILGFSLILSRRKNSNYNKFKEISDDTNQINIIFGGEKKVISAKDIKSLKASVMFGALELDLLDADFEGNEAYLELDCIFAGVEVIINRSINVIVSGSPIFGGFDDKTRQNIDENSKTLYINYTAIFGGVELKN